MKTYMIFVFDCVIPVRRKGGWNDYYGFGNSIDECKKKVCDSSTWEFNRAHIVNSETFEVIKGCMSQMEFRCGDRCISKSIWSWSDETGN